MCPFDASWEKVYSETSFGGGYPDTHLVRFVARNLYCQDRRSKKVLELGCGVGANLWYLAREGFDVFGIDGSKTAIEKCQSRLKDQNLNCTLSIQDACRLDFPDNCFDAVVDVECIYANTMPDIEQILRETYRVLQKGGCLFSMMFGRKTTGYGLGKEIDSNTFSEIKSRSFENRGIAHFFDQSEIRSLLSEIGYSSIEINNVVRTENNQQQVIEEWLVQAKK